MADNKISNVIQINDPKFKEPIKYYLNPRLKKNFDQKIIPSLLEKDKDCVLGIDGSEGCQPKGEKVLMADGSWKNVEDIKEGDLVLSPQKNQTHQFSKVIKTFKWKCNEIYEVKELNRQNKTLYNCSYNHLIPINRKVHPRINGKREAKDSYWKIDNYKARAYSKLSKVGTKKNDTTILSFPINKFNGKANFEIEPYTLGVFLGDSHFSSILKMKENKSYNKKSLVKGHWRNFKSGKKVWQSEHNADHKRVKYLRQYHRDIGITSMDKEIIDEVTKHYEMMSIINQKDNKAKTYRFSVLGKLSEQLSKAGLEGKGSGKKFIPKKALLSDLDYRKKLLAGLIDTDGYCKKRENSFSITTKSKKLAEGIYNLVRSLGGRGRIRKIKKGIKKINFIGEYFDVSFYLGNLDLPTKLKRKKNLGSIFYISPNRCSIDVVRTNRKEFVYGFTLDSPSSWYITNDYTITHNSGKSTLAFQIGKYVDPTLNLDRIVFDAESFRQAIFKATKGQCVIFDEAFTGFSSRASLSAINRALVNLMMQMRQKNLFVIIVLPTFFLLDKYVALWRTKALIHVYENKGRRGYFRLYNKKKKKLLYLFGKQTYSYNPKINSKERLYTNFKGHFYGVFALGDKETEKKYRKKKIKALEDTEKNPMTAGQVKYREQRDIIIYLLRKNLKLTYQELAELLSEYDFAISYVQIRNICVKFGDIEKEADRKGEKNVSKDK